MYTNSEKAFPQASKTKNVKGITWDNSETGVTTPGWRRLKQRNNFLLGEKQHDWTDLCQSFSNDTQITKV